MLDYLITILLFCGMLMFFTMQFYKLKNNLHIQNIKAISLYLDKKFINKLLLLLLDKTELERLHFMMDEIISYFCLDYMAIRLKNEDAILSFKSHSNQNYYTEKEVKKLLVGSESIKDEVGSLIVREEFHKEFIVFKHKQLILLAVLEAKHKLSSQEKDTLGNEIMSMIKLAIFATLNFKKDLRNFA